MKRSILAVFALACASLADAQPWPAKPIRYIVIFAPEVPMAAAGLPGYEISSWQALFAPAGTPKDIVARLYAETVKALKAPDVAKRIQELGLDAGGMAPEELAALIRNDIPRLKKIVRDSGAKVD